jgi:hypothetical protein
LGDAGAPRHRPQRQRRQAILLEDHARGCNKRAPQIAVMVGALALSGPRMRAARTGPAFDDQPSNWCQLERSPSGAQAQLDTVQIGSIVS